MPSEILGLFTTPEQYQQNQLAQVRSRAFQEVQLDPFQQAALGARTAGYQFGQAVGGALGGQDPQLQLIARRQQLLSQLDRSDPMSYRRVAKMASDAGDQELAQSVAEAGMKAQTEINRAAQLGAEKMTSEQRNALAYADSVAPRDTIEHNEAFQSRFDQLTLKSEKTNKPFEFEAREARVQDLKASLRVLESQPAPNKEAIQRLKDSIQSIEGVPKAEQRISFGAEAERKSKSMYGKPYADLTSEEADKVDKAVEASERAKAKSGAANVSTGGVSINTEEAGKAAAKVIGANVANVESQFSLQTAIGDSLKLIDNGIYAGAYGPEKGFVAKFSGGTIGDSKKVQNTEVFLANIGEIVIPRLVQFGGNDSNEELKYLQKVVAGDQRLEPESMKRILISAEKKTANNIRRLQKQAESGGKGANLPLEPMQPTLSQPKANKRYNPQTKKVEVITGD